MSGEEDSGEEETPEKNASLKAFWRGMFVVAILYGALAGWLWRNADLTRQVQQGRLASQTIPVEHIKQQVAEVMGPPAPASESVAAAPEIPEVTEVVGVTETTKEPGPEAHPAHEEAAKAPAPVSNKDLYEQTSDGPLPVRAADGRTVFQAFRKPYDKEKMAAGKPVISLALINLGLSDAAGDAALRTMPPEVTFALSPYTSTPDMWIQESKKRGHEVWLTLPLESLDYPASDPGPHTLLVSAPERQNQNKLNWLMSRGTGIVGFVGSEKPIFMDSINDMRPEIGTIFNRGMGFIDTAPNPSSAARSMALGMNASYASADLWLDESPTKESITEALASLEKIAQQKGSAIGLFRPYPVSYQEVQRWIETLPQKNIALAPLSAQTD